MNSRKVYCLYHQKEIITNFCRDKNCFMPLCPTCIREHTEYHQQIKTKPNYQNILQTYSEVKGLIAAAIYQVEQNRKKNAQIFKKINNWQHSIKDILGNAKTLVHGWVDEHFRDLQKEIVDNYDRVHHETGVFSVNKTQQFEQQLNHSLNELTELYQSLKSQKYIGNMILFLQEKQHKYGNAYKKYASFQQANDKYMPNIEMQNNFKGLFFNCLSRMLRINRPVEKDQQEDRYNRSKSPRPNNGKLKKYNDEKKEKMQRSYTPEKSIVFTRNKDQSNYLGYSASKNSPYTNRYGTVQSGQGQQLMERGQLSHRNERNRLQNSIYRGFK